MPRAGTGNWALKVRQRYRYDGANQRIVKQTLSEETSGPAEAVTLYAFPGDYERRGVVTDQVSGEYDPSAVLGTESQYVVTGARVVFNPGGVIDRDMPLRRIRELVPDRWAELHRSPSADQLPQ